MAETFEAYRARVLSYLADEEPIGVQQATPSQLERRLGAGPHIRIFLHHHESGFPTRRGFRRVGTTDAYSLSPAVLHHPIRRTRISAFGASFTSTGPRAPRA
jgi:hypothetical protein